MIIRSRWRRAGRLARHLGRTDTNERVRTRPDLCREAPEDTTLALALFAAISRTNPRVVRDYIHIKVSPGGPALNDEQIARVITLIEREHHIPATTPRHVKEHGLGLRADHFHLVYPVVDPTTGAAARSNGNFLADEIASRLAEIELGERIVPGPRQTQVVAELRRRGLTAQAAILAGYEPVRAGDRVGDRTRQQAAGRDGNAEVLMDSVFAAWTRSGGDLAAFRKELAVSGIEIVRGDRAILAMDLSGVHVPLARAVRQKGKAAGRPVEIRERDLRDLADEAETVPEARERALGRKEKEAEDDVRDEFDRMAAEADLDGQRQLAERLRIARDHYRLHRQHAIKRSSAARRREIRAAFERRDRIRRARVARAFRVAGLLDRRDMRQTAIALAAAGVLMGGGGLGLALVVAGIAVAALPLRERARAIAFDARLTRKADRTQRDRDLAKTYDEVAAEHGKSRPLRFDNVPKTQRALVGLLARLVLDDNDGHGRTSEVRLAAARALGPLAPQIEATLLGTAGRGGLALLRWFDPSDPRHRSAAAAALHRAGEHAAAARVAPNKPARRRREGPQR